MIEIYGKPQCPECKKAKAYCETKEFDFVYKTLGIDFTKEELLEQFPQAKTVPQISVQGKPVGTFQQFLDYISKTDSDTGVSL